MLRRALSVCAVLGMVSAAQAGVAITLVPAGPGPDGIYEVGDTVQVDILAQLTPGTPSVQPTGTQNQIRVRLFNLDLTDTDPGLAITPVLYHADRDYDDDPETLETPIPFWNFTASTRCTGDAKRCGSDYFIDSDLVTITPNILNITWAAATGTSSSGQIVLNQTTNRLVASLNVTFTGLGDQTLDVLNADETSLNLGAEIRHGHGVAADPTDPLSPIRANGGAMFQVGGPTVFNVVPEPATLALLGLGGVAAAFRRRRSA